MLTNPSFFTPIEKGDIVITIGKIEDDFLMSSNNLDDFYNELDEVIKY